MGKFPDFGGESEQNGPFYVPNNKAAFDSPPPYSYSNDSSPTLPAYASPPVQVILSPHNNPGMLSNNGGGVSPPTQGNYLPITRQDRILLQGSTKEQRNLFLRNVFGILSCQAVVITGLIGLFFYIPDFRSGIVGKGFFTFWGYWCSGALGTCGTTLLYKLMRKPPVNLVLLGMITLLWGGLLATLAARFQGGDNILVCSMIVASVCLCVVFFTFNPKYHFTPIISMFYVWALLLIAFGIIIPSYAVSVKDAAYVMIAPTSFCTYLVVAAQLIMKDENKKVYSNEFVFGAVQISMYVVAILAKILFRIYSAVCPCCSCCCERCGDVCDEI